MTTSEPTNREEHSDRSRPPRDVPPRPVRPPIVKQPVTITVDNGEITVQPVERDLFDGEQIEWICQQIAWEVRFDQPGSTTPFTEDLFGPGLLPPSQPDINPDLPSDEIPTDVSGPVREDVLEGLYSYSAQINGFGPVMARIKIIRGGRP